MSISAYVHVERSTEIEVSARSGSSGDYVVLEAGGLALFIKNREKVLEIASRLESAAQKWDEEE